MITLNQLLIKHNCSLHSHVIDNDFRQQIGNTFLLRFLQNTMVFS
jgi:hypothetical protein